MRTLESRSTKPIPGYANATVLGPLIAAEAPEAADEPLPCPDCGQSVTMFSLWGHAGCLDKIFWQEAVALREVLA